LIYQNIIKSFCDILIAVILLIIFSPVIFITAIGLCIINHGSIFFIQKRPGYKCVPFNIYKFKTMKDLYDQNGELLPDEIRITKIGKLVRTFSIDELLQLINVIKGDMSLVGPRPLLMQYLERYSEDQIKRHNVKPGITGWAQVNGRNAISWQKKFEFDLEYVHKISFLLDFKILLKTFIKVISRNDINSDGHATMQEFNGNKLL
jgi:undecaprenyl phosphate N,N'-diacetylbacillosamine 1-phosphate transferase